MAFHLSTEFEALKHDINTLFSNFHEKQSVRFEDFCAEWRNLNFSCIFGATARNTVGAKMRIVERLFRVASEFLSEEATFLYRVATVYTFYAVYFKQITPTKVKIRMTPTMWTDLMQFLEILKEHQHYDVVYIIHVLRKHKAFNFTAFTKELIFGRLEFMVGIEGSSGFKHFQERDDYVDEISNDDGFLARLKDTQSDYSEVKEKLLAESKEEEREDLSKILFYSNSEFPEDISKMVLSHKRKYTVDESPKCNDSTEVIQRPVLSQLHELQKTSLGYDDENKEQTRPETLSQLKERLWSADITAQKGSKYTPESAPRQSDIQEELEHDRAYYKKSAMLQINAKRRFKGNPKRNQTGLRFKAPEQEEGEDI